MAQRRTPSGQGPGRSRTGRAGRPTGRSTRPGARRTGSGRAGGAKRTRAPRPKGRFTGRAAILALLVSALVLAYAQPVRLYFQQRAEIERYTESQRAQEKRIADLEKELQKWEDPEYVRAQARNKLYFIRPGETPYKVVGYKDRAAKGAAAAGAGRGGAWHERMWGSIAAADRAGG